MKIEKTLEFMEDLADDFPGVTTEKIKKTARSGQKRQPASIAQFIQSQDDSRKSFEFTYHASRHEQGWLLAALGGFYERGWIADILRMVKGGKEASVYQCASGQAVPAPSLAAKVFRPRQFRNLKKDHLYRLDREVLDENGNRIVDLGMLKAQRKRSVYGEQIRHQSWLAHEFQALKTLHAAGADVPQPYEMGENAILMGFIGDDLSAAPTLNTVRLPQRQVKPLFERVLHNVELMLANEMVHADLSAYNILYWNGEITLIDFPQVISPLRHHSAFQIFSRDITRLCEYFNSQGLRTHPAQLAADLWLAHGYKLREEKHPDLLEVDHL
jgi:RIO kinase 1